MVMGFGGLERKKKSFSYASKIRIRKANPPLACDVEDVHIGFITRRGGTLTFCPANSSIVTTTHHHPTMMQQLLQWWRQNP
jgi:ethanolamine utilization microcompartment shell protein EutS